jgi:hypothetical protein
VVNVTVDESGHHDVACDVDDIRPFECRIVDRDSGVGNADNPTACHHDCTAPNER